MSQEDLNNYKYQLEQVNITLEADPSDEELKKLKKDIEEAIELILELLPQNASLTEPSVKSQQWKVGDVCEAKYKADGKYYEAVIQTMAADRSFFVVTFTGYNQSQNVTIKEIRKKKEERHPEREKHTNADKRVERNNVEKSEKKEVKNEVKKKDKISEKEAAIKEHEKKKNSWQKFTTKNQSKMKAAVSKTEVKKTLTAQAKRGKHKFSEFIND